jgi:hypothetical protein
MTLRLSFAKCAFVILYLIRNSYRCSFLSKLVSMNAYTLSLKAVRLKRSAPFYKTGTSYVLKSVGRLIIKETKAISSRLKLIKRFK